MSKLRLAFILATTCSAVFGSTIVVPNFNTTNVGNDTDSNGPTPDIRFQEILGSGQFASVGSSLLIDQLSFRSAPGTGSVDISIATVNLLLSTSPKFPNTGGPLLSTTFADNVGPDNKLVYSGPVTFHSAGCAGPGVCPFDLSVNFTTPFLYDPAQGRLLLDFTLQGFTVTGNAGGALDSVTFSAPNGGSIANVVGLVNSTTGDFDFSGDIVQLRYTAVAPEPASFGLMGLGVAALLTIRLRRA